MGSRELAAVHGLRGHGENRKEPLRTDLVTSGVVRGQGGRKVRHPAVTSARRCRLHSRKVEAAGLERGQQ